MRAIKHQFFMKAIEFPEVNVRYAESQDEYETLPAHVDPDDRAKPSTFCFELDKDEKKQIAKTGQIWITTLTFGHALQPIRLSAMKPMMVVKEVEQTDPLPISGNCARDMMEGITKRFGPEMAGNIKKAIQMGDLFFAWGYIVWFITGEGVDPKEIPSDPNDLITFVRDFSKRYNAYEEKVEQ